MTVITMNEWLADCQQQIYNNRISSVTLQLYEVFTTLNNSQKYELFQELLPRVTIVAAQGNVLWNEC